MANGPKRASNANKIANRKKSYAAAQAVNKQREADNQSARDNNIAALGDQYDKSAKRTITWVERYYNPEANRGKGAYDLITRTRKVSKSPSKQLRTLKRAEARAQAVEA